MALDLLSLNNPNAGAPAGDRSRGIIRYLVIGSYAFSKADYSSANSFKAAFKAATLKSRTASGKLIVLPVVMDVNNATDADKEGSLNQGFKETLLEGFPAFKLGVRISNRQAQILRQMNQVDTFISVVDDQKLYWGTKFDDGSFKGEAGKLFVGGDTFADGQKSKVVEIAVSYTNVSQFKDASAYFPINFDVSQYGQLKDVDITDQAPPAANVFHLQATMKTGRVGTTLNVYDDYKAILALKANWSASIIKAADGSSAACPITSVAGDDATKSFTFTADAAAFGGMVAGDQLVINFMDPQTLDTAGATGIEGVPYVYIHA